MAINPIRSERDHASALRRIEELWGARAGTPNGDELDVLATLVESYEREHYPIPFPSPIDAIKFRLEQLGEDYSALIGIIGQRTRVYEVMRGARPLSLNMIRRLHEKLQIPAEVLLPVARPRGARPPLGRASVSRRSARLRRTA